MNAETLRRVTDIVTEDFTAVNLPRLLQRLQEAFQQSVQSMTPDTVRAFDEAREAVNAAAAGHLACQFSAAQLHALAEMHGADLCGNGLRERLDNIFSTSLTPAAIATGIEELRTRLQQFIELTKRLRADLDSIGIKYSDSADDPDDADVEVVLPTAVFDGTLAGLAKESERLNAAILPIVEIASGSRPPLKIRSVATGSLELVVIIDLPSAVALLTLIGALTNLVVGHLSLKKVRLELEKAAAPKEYTEGLRGWEMQKIQEGQERLRAELLKAVKDEGRRNELEKEMTRSIAYLTDRIDRHMQVSVQPRGLQSQATDGQPAPVSSQQLALRQQIEALNAELRAIPKWEEPSLALLSDGEAADDSASAAAS